MDHRRILVSRLVANAVDLAVWMIAFSIMVWGIRASLPDLSFGAAALLALSILFPVSVYTKTSLFITKCKEEAVSEAKGKRYDRWNAE